MKADIHFNTENLNRDLKEYDLFFFEIAINHASFKKKYFKELVKKWSLNSLTGKIGTKESELITYYNGDCSLAITGLNENLDDIPHWYISLTFSIDMKLKDVIEFLRDFTDSLDYYDSAMMAIGINQNDYIRHIKEIVEKMLSNIKWSI